MAYTENRTLLITVYLTYKKNRINKIQNEQVFLKARD